MSVKKRISLSVLTLFLMVGFGGSSAWSILCNQLYDNCRNKKCPPRTPMCDQASGRAWQCWNYTSDSARRDNCEKPFTIPSPGQPAGNM